MNGVSAKRLQEDALYKAQDMMWDAWDSPNKRERVALAKAALELSPLCADAYTMLALETGATPAQKIELFRKAVEAGETALGKKAFRDFAGEFWGFVEARPYMRARHYLAMALWEKGERDDAVVQYQGMLELNPSDNQGIRYLLIDCLLTLGRDKDAEALLDSYKHDIGAGLVWSRVLLMFRLHGDGAASRKALKHGLKINKHVPAYLLEQKKMPDQLPDYNSFGGEDEAVSYVHQGGAGAWVAAPAALAWLATQCGESPVKRKSKSQAAKGAA